MICGGGDSALDWTVALCDKARSLTLVHRRAEFRAAPPRWRACASWWPPARCSLLEGNVDGPAQRQPEARPALRVQSTDGTTTLQVPADHVLAFFGLHPKLGPIAEWGLELEKKALKVDTEKFQTSVPGIFAIGDINTYPGKKKLISERLSRGRAGGLRHPASPVPGEAAVSAVHDHQPDHAEAPGRGRQRMALISDEPAARRSDQGHDARAARDQFVSRRKPRHRLPQVFGGQVLGQALVAATATVENRVVHSLHAYFLRRGDFNSPIVYEVDRAGTANIFPHGAWSPSSMASRSSTCRPPFSCRSRAGSPVAMPEVPPPGDAGHSRDAFEGCARDFAAGHAPRDRAKTSLRVAIRFCRRR